MFKRTVMLLGVLALCASCQKFAEGRQMFRELLTLRDEIAAEFHEKVVDVNVANGDRMTIKFINSPFATRTRDEKQKRADEVAAFVQKHYKHPVASVTTAFVAQSGGLGSGESYVGRPPQNQ
jgi:hypothetical protein